MTSIIVHADQPVGPLPRIWESFGYDELNWTATPRGRKNMATMRAIFGKGAVVRAHNLLTSGNGRGLPHWSSGNVYHEDSTGTPTYDWSQVDPVFDVWLEHDMTPLVELGFCPVTLVRPFSQQFQPMPSLYGEYESWGWASVPRDPTRWGDLIEAVVRHFRQRYGEKEVANWYWEFWNEPDISYWQGTLEEYCLYYDHTVAAVRRALPDALVGGPATTGRGVEFLDGFLAHCIDGRNSASGATGTAVDFVSFHTKGAPTFERSYGVIGPDGAEVDRRQSPSTDKMLSEIDDNLAIIRTRDRFLDTRVFVDECDPGVPAHLGVFDNKNYNFRNTEYYAVFQLQLMGSLLRRSASSGPGVSLATAWAWYMEGDRYFEGTRSFFTASDVPAPVTNAYRMLSRLGKQQLSCEVSPDRHAGPSAIGVLASANEDGSIAAIVWNHDDDQYNQSPPSRVTVDIDGSRLGGRPVTVREYLIDANHSNSYSIWRSLGAPQNPPDEAIANMRVGGGLQMVKEEKLAACPLSLRQEVSLRLPAAVLIEISEA